MAESVVVETKCGPLRGTLEHSVEGYDYCSFKGVPYAEPPVGSLRFRDPVPIKPWTEIRDANKFGPDCPQYDMITKVFKGEEDCLYLNVYVKSIKPNANLPVLVWIHGGAFIMCSGDDTLFGPDYFLKKDVVLVTINYRFGVLGFLNFDDEASYGNQGLKDQVMALQWVKENIANFSGNPNNVTIFGESAGGASVHLLALSPIAKGLFHKAISQSGVACSPWTIITNTDNSYKICKALGNDSEDPKKLVEFLRTIDYKKLLEAQKNIMLILPIYGPVFPFSPVIDSKAKVPVVPVDPIRAMQNGIHIPYIFGYTSREGMYFLPGLKDEDFEKLDQDFDAHMSPRILKTLARNNMTPSQLRNLYFGSEKITFDRRDIFSDLLSDMLFVEGTHKAVRSQVRNSSSPTYLYRFCYDKGFSLVKHFGKVDVSGASHGDELPYQFYQRLLDALKIERPKPGTTGYKIMEQMVEMWVNFAKYGRPTPEVSNVVPTFWLPVTDEDNLQILDINENLQMQHVQCLEERFKDFLKNSN